MNDKQDFKMIEQQQQEEMQQRNVFAIRAMTRGALVTVGMVNKDNAIPKETIMGCSNSVAKDEITFGECLQNVHLLNAISVSTFMARLDQSFGSRVLCEATLANLEIKPDARNILNSNLAVLLSLVLGYSNDEVISELAINITGYKIVNEILNVLLDSGSVETAVAVQRYKVNFLSPETLEVYVNLLSNLAKLLKLLIDDLQESYEAESKQQQEQESPIEAPIEVQAEAVQSEVQPEITDVQDIALPKKRRQRRKPAKVVEAE